MSDLSGQYLGRYYLEERLGEGGMAVVYKAYDTRLERTVAIKIIRAAAFPTDELSKVRKRFEREAKLLAKLSHPNIVKVHDYGEHNESPYLVMEYMPGGTLKKKLGKPIPWQEAIRLLLPVARGVEYAHQHSLLHRDIKPANVLITDSGEPMLSDFGIAKLFEGGQTTALTGKGMVIGTPEYMAPEQWKGQSSPQSDLYSLGVVLYELLTGRKPYMADTPAAILIQQATEPLTRPSNFTKEIPDSLERVLIKALERESKERFHDVGAFVRALENIQAGAPVILPDGQGTTEDTYRVPSQDYDREKNDETDTVASRPAKDRMTTLARVPWRLSLPLTIILVICLIGILGSAGVVYGVRSSKKTSETAPALMPTKPELLVTSTSVVSPPTATKIFVAPTPTENSNQKLLESMVMISIPAGEFIMGAGNNDGKAKEDERPQQVVYLDQYWIDSTEVTAGMYMECVKAGICNLDAFFARTTDDMLSLGDYYTNPKYENFPAVDVSWADANRYCEWAGKRLPTEAEWEKAARGTDGQLYPWGNQWQESALNFCDLNCPNDYRDNSANDQYQYRAPVGSFSAGKSAYGLFDMAGNVWEWVADWYSESYYANPPSDNPTGPSSGTDRVVRGGGWDSTAQNVRASKRFHRVPAFSSGSQGFRCARSP